MSAVQQNVANKLTGERMVEKEKADYSKIDEDVDVILYNIKDNFDNIPGDLRNELLLKLSLKEEVAGAVVLIVTNNFDKLPDTVRDELLLNLSKHDISARDVARIITSNFNKLPENVRDILFQMYNNHKAAGEVVRAVIYNFDKLPENVRFGLLVKIYEMYKGELPIFYKLPLHVRNKLPENIRDLIARKDSWSYKHPALAENGKEPVLLGVSAPKAVKPGDIFTARFVAYIESLEEKVKQELTALSRGRSESIMGFENCNWKIDTHVTVKLSGRHLKVDPSEIEFVWKGNRNIVSFSVGVLTDAPQEWTILQYEVYIEGIRVALIHLDLEITSSTISDERSSFTIKPAHTAFASYASQDKVRVMDRVAAVSISAHLDIFTDCLSIHPGEDWKKRLESEIKNRDIFLLFWSANAKNSEWVTWEWKTALVRKGESAIQLHPLQTINEAPPPEELKKFHFGDVYMIVRNAEEKKF